MMVLKVSVLFIPGVALCSLMKALEFAQNLESILGLGFEIRAAAMVRSTRLVRIKKNIQPELPIFSIMP